VISLSYSISFRLNLLAHLTSLSINLIPMKTTNPSFYFALVLLFGLLQRWRFSRRNSNQPCNFPPGRWASCFGRPTPLFQNTKIGTKINLPHYSIFFPRKNTKSFYHTPIMAKLSWKKYRIDHNASKGWYWASAGKTLTTAVYGHSFTEGLLKHQR